MADYEQLLTEFVNLPSTFPESRYLFLPRCHIGGYQSPQFEETNYEGDGCYICAGLSCIRALGTEDLRVLLSLVDRNLDPENLISPTYEGPTGPLVAFLKRPMDKLALCYKGINSICTSV
ncbi:hypothetical protein TNCV_4969381 [Trichonephila clavipes]|nr:hypothetical protein TNCV_4969381 [Trichonephila clavipes]